MRKLYLTLKHKRANQRRIKRSLKKRIRKQEYLRNKNSSLQGSPHQEKYVKAKTKSSLQLGYELVVAPRNFSFRENPDLVVKFIDKIEKCYEKRKPVFVDMKGVAKISDDAIVVLIAIIVNFIGSKIKFNGNFPSDGEASYKLRTSGFFEILRDNLHGTKHLLNQREKYQFGKSNGIYTNAQKTVNSALGADIIKQASTTVWKTERRCQGLQRTFIELMQNTFDHAAIANEGDKHWWLSVNHMDKQNKVGFAFVDFGVGIFKSLSNKPNGHRFENILTKLKDLFGITKQHEFLEKILTGKMHLTATNEPHRGKGLPGIKDAMDRNSFSNLLVITNKAYGDVANGDYRELNINFEGTFIYWELNDSNRNIDGRP